MSESASASRSLRRVRPKYQVFISSTYEDLHEERQNVTWEILKARQIPAGMENFSANPDRGWNIIKQTIDVSDYYVVLVAGRYGSPDPETGLSWTQREYEYAVSKHLAVFAFLRSNESITADKIERDPVRQRMLEAFISKLRDAHHCETWHTSVDLCAKVSQALSKGILDDEDGGNPPPGWFRGTAVPSPEAMEEFFRLSAENKRLRDLVASHTPAKPKLRMAPIGGEPVGGVFTETRERIEVELTPEPRLAFHEASNDKKQDFVDRYNSALRVEIEIANSGTAPARNVVIDMVCDNTAEIELNRLDPPMGLVVSVGNIQPWWTDPNEHVYVDSRRVEGGHGHVRQRAKLVGVGAKENLVPVVFVLSGNAYSTRHKACLRCTATSEDGSSVSGEFHFEINLVGTKCVTWESLAKSK